MLIWAQECIACVRERIRPDQHAADKPLDRAALLKLDSGKAKVLQLDNGGWKTGTGKGKEPLMNKMGRSVDVDVSRDEAISEVMDSLALDVVGDYEVGQSDSEGLVEDSDDDDDDAESDYSM